MCFCGLMGAVVTDMQHSCFGKQRKSCFLFFCLHIKVVVCSFEACQQRVCRGYLFSFIFSFRPWIQPAPQQSLSASTHIPCSSYVNDKVVQQAFSIQFHVVKLITIPSLGKSNLCWIQEAFVFSVLNRNQELVGKHFKKIKWFSVPL